MFKHGKSFQNSLPVKTYTTEIILYKDGFENSYSNKCLSTYCTVLVALQWQLGFSHVNERDIQSEIVSSVVVDVLIFRPYGECRNLSNEDSRPKQDN